MIIHSKELLGVGCQTRGGQTYKLTDDVGPIDGGEAGCVN